MQSTILSYIKNGLKQYQSQSIYNIYFILCKVIYLYYTRPRLFFPQQIHLRHIQLQTQPAIQLYNKQLLYNPSSNKKKQEKYKIRFAADYFQNSNIIFDLIVNENKMYKITSNLSSLLFTFFYFFLQKRIFLYMFEGG